MGTLKNSNYSTPHCFFHPWHLDSGNPYRNDGMGAERCGIQLPTDLRWFAFICGKISTGRTQPMLSVFRYSCTSVWFSRGICVNLC